MNYERDMEINPNALDVEWLEQSVLYLRYVRLQADAKMEMDKCKEGLSILRAEVYERIVFRALKKDGGKKPTEAMIESSIVQDNEYSMKMQEYREFVHELDILTGTLRAIDHRRSALENLVRLNNQEWFSSPSVPRDLGREQIKEAKRKEAIGLTDEGLTNKTLKKKKKR